MHTKKVYALLESLAVIMKAILTTMCYSTRIFFIDAINLA